jgi:3-demethylubiquinone-9 3-methyltransferase
MPRIDAQYPALNGGPEFTFDEAISFLINCAGQDEVDYYWNALSEGGEEGPCGWLKDRYGLSWQGRAGGAGGDDEGSRPGTRAARHARLSRHEEARSGRAPGGRRPELGT